MNFSQLIMNGILNSNSNNIFGKIKEKLLLNVRDRFMQNNHSLIKYKLDGKIINLPFSHNLPINRKVLPLYSENIGRIADYLSEKFDNLRVIDIGANVGDTVFIIKSKVDAPILCIEGDEFYYTILMQNISQWQNVIAEKVFIGDKSKSRGSYSSSLGSGRIIENTRSEDNIKFEALPNVVSKYPEFENAKLLKIDTDGFDGRILKSSIDYLKKIKPVIFFEYDPYLLQQLDDDGLSIFNTLSEIGYETAIFYDNSGDYLLTSELNQKNIIEDIHYYYSGRNIERYCDVCAFHSEDKQLALKVRDEELKYFSVKRKFNF